MLIKAARHPQKKAKRTSTTRKALISKLRARLAIAISMKVAGRKSVASKSILAKPGRSASNASSIPAVTSRVLTPGSFSMTRRRLGLSLMIASPINGW